MRVKTRREVLETMAALATGAAVLPKTQHAWAEPMPTYPGVHFGVQLNAFPIDPNNFQSFLDTLAIVKQIGYQGFESSFRNLQNQFNDPAPARRKIEQTGLTFFGVHIFFPNEKYDQQTHIAAASVYEPVARGAAALGARHLILSGFPTANSDQLKRKIDALNVAGKFARSLGLGLAFHNEYWPAEEMEKLYTETDPEVVHFLLDCGHAYHGGADVPAFIRAHAKRIVGFHLRDYKNGHLSTLGTGTFPLAQVAQTIEQIRWKGWVENEEERENHSQNGAEVIRPAFKAMEDAFRV